MSVTVAGVSPRRRIRVTRLLCVSFRRSLTEVVWFVVAALLLHELHDARGAVALPSLFALY